jgi:hypothetical protein
MRFHAFLIVLASAGCQQPAAATKQEAAAPPPAKAEASARFETPRAVYKRYAEALNAARWSDAIALFSPIGKSKLVLANFKGLALLAGSQHPKQPEYQAVLHDFCQAHSLRCADERWNEQFAPTLRQDGNVSELLRDVAQLAAAKPEATYVEIMKLLQGVDANAVVGLDPTLSEVVWMQGTATGVARRADGQTSTMTFESSEERGWMIVE